MVGSRLKSTKKGPIIQPTRWLVYGPEGLGKSTLAADAPGALMLDIEDGSSRLGVGRYMFSDGSRGHVPSGYQDIVTALADVRENGRAHGVQTLVIDSLDAVETMIIEDIVTLYSRTNKKIDTVSDIPFGGWIAMALQRWSEVLNLLDRVRFDTGADIVLVGHSHTARFSSPLHEDFDRVELRLHKRYVGRVKEWCDNIGYLAFDMGARRTSESPRAKGWDTGRRYIHFKRCAGFDAKARDSLPDKIEITTDSPWKTITSKLEAETKNKKETKKNAR